MLSSVVVLKINSVEPQDVVIGCSVQWGPFLPVPACVAWVVWEPLRGWTFPPPLTLPHLYLQRESHPNQYANEVVWSCLRDFLLCDSNNNWFHGSGFFESFSPPLSGLLFFRVIHGWFVFLAPPWLLNAHFYRNMSMLTENMFGHSLPL